MVLVKLTGPPNSEIMTQRKLLGRPSGPIQAWNAANYYESGDIVKNASGTKYYRMRGNGTNKNPEDEDWAAAGTGTVTPSNLNYTDDSDVFSPNSLIHHFKNGLELPTGTWFGIQV